MPVLRGRLYERANVCVKGETESMEYEVEILPAKKRFKASDDESILAAAVRNKISLAFKCGNGSCKTCHARLLTGSVTYPWKPPQALRSEEIAAGSILVCQAAATSDIAIEATVQTGLREEARLHEIKLALDGIKIRKGLATVSRVDRACHDVTILRLTPDQPFNWLPGQYLTLGAKELERDFSIANLSGPGGEVEMHIRHVPGGRFTSWIAQGIKPGDVVTLEGPLGTFFHRRKSRRPLLLVAGGTGFSPIKGVVLSALEQGGSVPIRLYWGVRAQRDLYEDALVREWSKNGRLTYTPVLSEPDPDDRSGHEKGFVHEAVERNEDRLGGFDIYIAGPPPMVEAVRMVVAAKGAWPERIFTDSFDFSASTQNRMDVDRNKRERTPDNQ